MNNLWQKTRLSRADPTNHLRYLNDQTRPCSTGQPEDPDLFSDNLICLQPRPGPRTEDETNIKATRDLIAIHLLDLSFAYTFRKRDDNTYSRQRAGQQLRSRRAQPRSARAYHHGSGKTILNKQINPHKRRAFSYESNSHQRTRWTRRAHA